jgi:hypothetical protein
LELEIEQDLLPDRAEDDEVRHEENAFLVDPGVEDATLRWLNERADGPYSQLIGAERVFSYYEAQRKVPLMFVLNVMSSVIGGYYNRNARVKDYLELCNDDFPEAEQIIIDLNMAAEYITSLDIADTSVWWNEANFFTLSVEVASNLEILSSPGEAATRLQAFEASIPTDYSLAAREAVNNRNQRMLRGRYVREAITGVSQADDQTEVTAEVTSGSEAGPDTTELPTR